MLKGERVMLRLRPGDEIIFKLKNSKRKWVTYVNNISDTAVVVHRDVIPYHSIDRIYFDQPKFYNRLGGAMVFGGAALFLIDQLNVVVVNGEDPSLDSWVSTVSITGIVAGLPMMLLKKKSQKLGYKYHLIMVKKGSPFYQEDTRESIY